MEMIKVDRGEMERIDRDDRERVGGFNRLLTVRITEMCVFVLI